MSTTALVIAWALLASSEPLSAPLQGWEVWALRGLSAASVAVIVVVLYLTWRDTR